MAIPMGGSNGHGHGGGGGGGGELCPAGPQVLVCCDVIDHGLIMTPAFGSGPPKPVHKITIRWLSQHLMKDGRPYSVQKRYTLSSHPKSRLRQDLEQWRGKPWTDEEAKAFDVERLIGKCALAHVAHINKPRGTFSEVMTLMPLMAGMPALTIPPSYMRDRDRKAADAARHAAEAPHGAPPDDDDIPPPDEPDGEYRPPGAEPDF